MQSLERPSVPHCVLLYARDGSVAGISLVDKADYLWLSQWTWRRSSDGYAVRSEGRGSQKRTVRLHRQINETPPDYVTDHVNGNKLDNRRCNLRTATTRQNNANASDRSRRSRFRGVYWHMTAGKWYAQISRDGKPKHLGLFASEVQAARAYDAAAAATHGDFARLNLAA